jgi:hypothetical protein
MDTAVTFVEHALEDHFGRPSVLPLVLVPDPKQPDFYGHVRRALLDRTGKKGTYTVKVGGIRKCFRIEDGGERHVTFHPMPERNVGFIAVHETIVSDRMVLNPWRC